MKGGILKGVLRFAAAVDEGVALSFRLCYGELGHRHFVEPKDTAVLAVVGNAIFKGAASPVDWTRLRIPESRADAAYFAPLKQLGLSDTGLYLGRIHSDDEEGTRERVIAAAEFVGTFGLATECGLGKSSQAELDCILGIAKSVTGPQV